MAEYKLLGNCQVCGRLQAVNRGMSKHGYKVDNGWFNGICAGEGYLPMQQDNSLANQVCNNIAAEIVELQKIVDGLKNGKIKPKKAPIASFYKAELVDFDEAPVYMQKQEIQRNIYANEGRIKQGEAHIKFLKNLMEAVSGQELKKEMKPEKAPQIMVGEKRQGEKSILTCTKVDGARIYWLNTKGFKGWTGTAAWRKLEIVA